MQRVLAERQNAAAEAMYRMANGRIGTPPLQRIVAQRQAAAVDAARRAAVQRKAAGIAGQARIPQSGGVPLPDDVRARFEPRLGADLSSVRLHTHGEAANVANALGARAFTVGEDIHFNHGEFVLGTKEGDRLLAHELTHVVQGQRSGIQRKAGPDPAAKENASASGGANETCNDNAVEAKGAEHDASQPDEPAEQEADAVADQIVDSLHGGDEEKGRSDEKEKGDDWTTESHTKASGDRGHGAAPPREPPSDGDDLKQSLPTIAAKLKGGGRRAFLAPTNPGPRSGAGAAPIAGSPSASSPGPGDAATSPAPPPFTASQAKAAIDSKAPDLADISWLFSTELVAKTQPEFDAEYADPSLLRHKVIDKFVSTGDPRTQTQSVGQLDPIAVQKFQDIDAEAHLSVPSLKDLFYSNLVAEMKKADFVDRTRTYRAMKQAAPPATFAFKGNPIPQNRISPFSSRNTSVDRLYRFQVIPADIDREIESNLPGATAKEIEDAKRDEALRKKAYRHILKKGRPPLFTIDTSQAISDYPTWYKPGEIVVNPTDPPSQEFARMMTLGALQPEWYPNGTIVLNIERKLSAASRVVKKPTAFDGLMSALWCSRNLAADDYGVTGGGIGEFLEAGVTFAEVTSATAIIPDDDFLADIQRVASQVKNALGGATTPAEELLRGNRANTSILNTTGVATGGVRDMYGQIIGQSTQEQNSPSAPPVVPDAASPTTSLVPESPSVAPGGVYDTSRSESA